MRHIVSKQNRALLSELVRTDFKLRYQGSAIGYAWSLLKPLFMFIVLYIVFVKFLNIGGSIPHYPVYLLLGIVLWNFFSELTQQGLTSIVNRGDLIRKIKIPRWSIIVSASISALINFGLNFIVLGVLMYFNGVNIRLSFILFPLIVFEIYLFALGLALILATTYVRYRDISHIWDVILQAAFYVIPIVYPISKITNVSFQKILLINPMAQAIQGARYSLVSNQTVTISDVFQNPWFILVPLVIVVTVCGIGVHMFKKESPYFAENL